MPEQSRPLVSHAALGALPGAAQSRKEDDSRRNNDRGIRDFPPATQRPITLCCILFTRITNGPTARNHEPGGSSHAAEAKLPEFGSGTCVYSRRHRGRFAGVGGLRRQWRSDGMRSRRRPRRWPHPPNRRVPLILRRPVVLRRRLGPRRSRSSAASADTADTTPRWRRWWRYRSTLSLTLFTYENWSLT
jgi:hypothetical protein